MKAFLMEIMILWLLAEMSYGSGFDMIRLRRKETEVNIEKYISYLNDYDVFYVDVDYGNDSLNGRSPWTHASSSTGPFLTIYGAIKAIRQRRRSLLIPAKLYLRSGFYSIQEELHLTSEDSNLEILAYPFDNERPVLSGAVRLWGKQFTRVHQLRNGRWIYQRSFTGTCSSHVFINDKRMVRARKPNLYQWTGRNLAGEGPYLVTGDLLLPTDDCQRNSTVYHQNCPPRNRAGFRFSEGDFAKNPTNIHDVEVLVFHAWTAERRFIQNITSDNRVLFRELLREPIGTRPQPSGWRYIIENSFEELDAVGEFYCDYKKKMLYIIPPDDKFMSAYVYVGANDQLIKGTAASNISFDGLEFKYTHDNHVGWFNARPSLMEFDRCSGIKVKNCVLGHVGHNAVVFFESRDIQIFGNHFYDIGNFAVNVANPKLGKSRVTTSQNIEISNNTFRGCGVYHMLQPSCVHVRGVRAIRVIGNDISQTPYAGIKVGWQKSFSPSHATFSNPVFFVSENHIHDYGLAILNDFAGVYLSTNMRDCGLFQIADRCHLHAVVSRNVIHEARSFAYGAAGVYSDTAASSVKVYDNWIYDVGGPAINFHCGLNNTATNNMIVHVNPNRIFGTCNHATANGDRSRQFFTMTKNVIFVENPIALMHRPGDWWEFDVPYLNLNVYFGGVVRGKRFFPKDFSMNQWRRETRNDMDSIIANPRYVSREDRVLSLRHHSPAKTLGIRSVDLTPIVSKKSNVWMFVH